MELYNILHITDLHFGESSNYDKAVDIKDRDRSVDFKNKFATNWQSIFFDEIKKINQNKKIDYIAFTGDLAQASKIDKNERIKRMELGLLFLKELCNKIGLKLDNLIIAPGNHDVDRNNSTDQFEDLRNLCKTHRINNYSVDSVISINISSGIMLLSINSCIGSNEKISTFDKEYFSNQIYALEKDRNFSSDITSIQNEEYFYQKDLDISAIGDDQNRDLIEKVNSSEVHDCCILLMHHNPIPTRCIEIRPYANLIDGGRLLSGLFETGKKVFILHGHTHFDYCMSSYFPDSNGKNFIVTLGGGALNGSANGVASLLEFVFCDKNHLKTTVSEIKRSGASFITRQKFEIYDKSIDLNLDLHWGKLERMHNYSFEELKEKLNFTNSDKELIRLCVLWDSDYFHMKRGNSKDYKNWKFIRVK